MYHNLNKLVEFLGSIVEIDLTHIDTKAIIYDQDSASAKHLLELVLELIVVLKREQMNQDGEDQEDQEQGEGEEDSREPIQFHSMERSQKSPKREEISEDYLKNEDSQEQVLSNSQVEDFHGQRLSSEKPSELLNEESLKRSGTKNNNHNNYVNTSQNKSKRTERESVNETGRYVYNAQKSCPDLVFVDENNENSDTSLNKYNLKP
jgi:hypothetical protein